MKFPVHRMRRMRASENLRMLVRETTLSLDQLIMPYFLVEGESVREEIRSMPGQFRYSIDQFLFELETIETLGLKHVILFGIPAEKNPQAAQAYAESGIIQSAVREIKKRFQNLTVITDVCLCEYMSHGHCGIVRDEKVLNDPSLELLAKTALSHAEAGADIVAPSDMMDGRVAAIRHALDQGGFEYLPVLSYAAKYASAFYGPFRDAAHSAPEFGDRKSYQMDCANAAEALREIQLDLEEGADLVMVKPALAYLDVIRAVKEKFNVPTAAYNVSGEYAMVKAVQAEGYIDERRVVYEILTSIRRAGANAILTYHARDVARWSREDSVGSQVFSELKT